MIQDISAYCFKNTFQKIIPIPENYFFSFREQKILLLSRQDGQYCLPTFRIMGFIAELDGSDIIHLERKELADTVWHSRFQLPRELADISITYEMIEALRLREMEVANEYIRNCDDMR